ncbi:MAG: toll/interleukin-1 receptor domain-containing protein [Acidimicrobiia bacterium]
MNRMEGLFVSYRRSDSQSEATLIRHALVAGFGDGRVFQDIVGIPIGEQFPDVLREQLSAAQVVVAVIGPGWLTAADQFGRRKIDMATDWVNIELSTALAAPTTVVPVLIDPTTMPPAEALPAELAALSTLNAFVCRKDKWDLDIAELVRQLGELTGWPVDQSAAVAAGGAASPIWSAVQSITGDGNVVMANVDGSKINISTNAPR